MDRAEFDYKDVKQRLEVLQADEATTNITVAPSSIADAGLGLFARKRFLRGDPITAYSGELIAHEEATRRRNKKEDSHIRRHVAFRVCIDGARLRDGTVVTEPLKQLIGCGLAQYANHDCDKCNADFEFVDSDENEAATKRFFDGEPFSSCSFDAQKRITFIYALADIEIGEEILVNYGRDYWNRS
jgi:SET domain-containing protein